MRLRLKSPDGKVTYPLGDLELELFAKASPLATAVFKAAIADDKYAGETFHRIIRGFVIQAGEGVDCEPYAADERGLALTFGVGALAMSNDGDADSGNAEFFVTTSRADELDGKYVIIGRVSDKSLTIMRAVEKCGDTDGTVLSDVIITATQFHT